ncbi:MAG: hypothetical protein P1U40_04850 [Coxiellaceae bacterium]|nr:hypothetical protein [Coxiellaceae bacterium]
MSDTTEKKATKSSGSKDSKTSALNSALEQAQTAYKKVVNPTTIAIATKVIKTTADGIQTVTQIGIKKIKAIQTAKAEKTEKAKAKPAADKKAA